VKTLATFFVFLAISSISLSGALPVRNRGTQLFVLISGPLIGGPQGGSLIVPITPANHFVLQQWNRCNATYDFVSAVVHRRDNGCRVTFTRYVMAQDYAPRIEHLDLVFPYTQQLRYQFFDIGSITGFYRNSRSSR
jgi:hypothetical protein